MLRTATARKGEAEGPTGDSFPPSPPGPTGSLDGQPFCRSKCAPSGWRALVVCAAVVAAVAGCAFGPESGKTAHHAKSPDWYTAFCFGASSLSVEGRFHPLWLASSRAALDSPRELPVLSAEEIIDLLRRPIPRPEAVPPEATLVEVIEQVSGKRLFWTLFETDTVAERILSTMPYRDFDPRLWSRECEPTFGGLLIYTLDVLGHENGLWPRCDAVGEPRFQIYLAFMEKTIQLVPLAIRECQMWDEDVYPPDWNDLPP